MLSGAGRPTLHDCTQPWGGAKRGPVRSELRAPPPLKGKKNRKQGLQERNKETKKKGKNKQTATKSAERLVKKEKKKEYSINATF